MQHKLYIYIIKPIKEGQIFDSTPRENQKYCVEGAVYVPVCVCVLPLFYPLP